MPVGVSLTAADYAVASAILLVPVAIGVFFAVKDAHKSSRDEYLLGGRQMPVIPVMLSLFITFQSGISQLGLPVESYFYGGIHFIAGCGLGLSYIIGAFTIVPLMYPLRITSVYEYLKLRYRSEAVRMVSTLVGMVTTICFMALALLSPALALGASAHVPLWVSVAVFGAVGTLYTAIGGFKSVVWTDVFQTVVIAIGITIILTKACLESGGVGTVWRIAQKGGRLDFNRFSPDLTVRHSIWGVTIAHCFMWLTHGFSQSTLQRISSMKTLHGAKVAYLSLTVIVSMYGALFSFLGFVIFAYFSHKQCDPFKAGFMSNRNELAPYFVLHAMSDLDGFSGLYVAILCCGSLSTLSSGLNALAANTIEDVLRRPLQNLKEGTVMFITKLIVAAYGALIISLAYLIKSFEGSIVQMSVTVFGAFGSPILGIFILGASFPWANKFGALAGAAVSLTFNLWISVGSKLYGSPAKTLPLVTTAGCSVFAGHANSTDVIMKNISLTLQPYTSNLHNISSAFTGQTNLTGLIVKRGENSNLDLIFSQSNVTNSRIPEAMDAESGIFVLYRISYEWYTFLGVVVCVAIGLAVSYITNCLLLYRQDDSPSERANKARYIFPFLRKFWGMECREFNACNASYTETPFVQASRNAENHLVLQTKEQLQLKNAQHT